MVVDVSKTSKRAVAIAKTLVEKGFQMLREAAKLVSHAVEFGI